MGRSESRERRERGRMKGQLRPRRPRGGGGQYRFLGCLQVVGPGNQSLLWLLMWQHETQQHERHGTGMNGEREIVPLLAAGPLPLPLYSRQHMYCHRRYISH